MGKLFKGRHLIDQDTRKLLFNAIVQSRLNYADVVWDNCSEKLNYQLQKIQYSGILFIFGLKKFDHVSEYRQMLKWVDVKGKRKQHTLQLFHKIKLNRSPLNLLDKINNSEISHGHATRSATRGNLATTYARTNIGRNGFINSAIRIWNQLPSDLRGCTNITTFRHKLHNYYFDQTECLSKNQR